MALGTVRGGDGSGGASSGDVPSTSDCLSDCLSDRLSDCVLGCVSGCMSSASFTVLPTHVACASYGSLLRKVTKESAAAGSASDGW